MKLDLNLVVFLLREVQPPGESNLTWMDEILHHLRNPKLMIPQRKYQQTLVSTKGLKVARNGFRPSTVGIKQWNLVFRLGGPGLRKTKQTMKPCEQALSRRTQTTGSLQAKKSKTHGTPPSKKKQTNTTHGASEKNAALTQRRLDMIRADPRADAFQGRGHRRPDPRTAARASRSLGTWKPGESFAPPEASPKLLKCPAPSFEKNEVLQ